MYVKNLTPEDPPSGNIYRATVRSSKAEQLYNDVANICSCAREVAYGMFVLILSFFNVPDFKFA